MNAAREAHPLKSIGCFIMMPISVEQLLRRILTYLWRIAKSTVKAILPRIIPLKSMIIIIIFT